MRSDELWVDPRDDYDEGCYLDLRWFNMRQEDPNTQEPTRFTMANLTPGGKFVVLLYTDGQVDLKEIKIKSEGKWDLLDVAQYKQVDPEGFPTMLWSQFLTETNIGRPLVAYVGPERKK